MKGHSDKVSHYYWNHNDLLGQGGFGKVFKGHDTNKQGQDDVVAVKLMDWKQMQDPQLIQLFNQESNALMNLKGKHIFGALDIFNQGPPNIIVISNLCDGGDLRKYLNKKGGHGLPEQEARTIFMQMLDGMKTCFENNFVHRDLKPENTFIDKGVFKIADFGFCQKVKHGQQLDFMGGTPGYMNPQIVLGMPYTEKCDVWTMGIIYYELLFGDIPGQGRDDESRIKDISHRGIKFPGQVRISEESREFLINTIKVEESQRWGWTQVFASKLWNSQGEQQNIPQQASKQLSQSELQFMISLQKYIKSQGPNSIQQVMSQFFPRGQINLQEFQQFCSNSKVSQTEIIDIFEYLDYQKDGQITIQEFEYKIMHSEYEIQSKNPVLMQQKFKALIKSLKAIMMKQNIDLNEIFRKYGTGNELNYNQLDTILKKLDPTLNDHELLIFTKQFDQDNSGTISKDEFLAQLGEKDQISMHNVTHLDQEDKDLIMRIKRQIKRYNLNQQYLFDQFDQKKDGHLDYSEFHLFVELIDRNITQLQSQKLFNICNEGNGTINLQQFMKFF